MTHLQLGLMAGVAFGVVSVATMIPLSLPDKTLAMTAAFIDRFAIGLVIALVQVSWPGWLTGLFFGVLLSLPSALITKSHVPIIAFGGVGGLVIGGLIHGWVVKAA